MALTTYIEAIKQGIWEEMESDDRVFVLGEDVGIYGGAFKVTAGMLEKFGELRVIDTPIFESAIVGAAIGAALMGMRPIAEMQFADFISCAFDQITNFAAKCRYRWGAGVPIVVRGPSGGGVHGGPFHSQNPEMYFVHTPGLEVLDLRSLLPFDKQAVLESVEKTNKVILLHEDTQIGGFAGELAAIISEEAFESLDGPIRRITAPDTPVPYSPPLEEFFLPKVSDVVRVARELYAY